MALSLQHGYARDISRWLRRAVVALVALMFLGIGASSASASGSGGSGSLTVRVSGLPNGQRPAAVLRGPHGLRRSVPARGLSIANAKVGSYRLMLSAVKVTRASGSIRRGATATALNRKVSVHLSAGHHTVLRGSYTSIINPGLKTFRGRVASVVGAAEDPSRVVLQGHVSLARHAVLSLSPSSMLPRGLLSKVVGVAYAPGKTTVSVKAASVYEVAPNFQFDAPLAASAQASASDAAASCGPAAGLSPYRHIKDVSFSGGWDTVNVLGAHITDGVKAAVHFTAEAGLNVTAGAGLACSLSASFFASGMAGPIPVTAGIEGDLDGSAAIGGALTTGGSVHVSAGAHTVGVPPALAWLPDVSFSDPQFAFNAKSFAQATAGIGFTVKAGIGNGNIASVTLNMGTSVNFSAQPGTCDWSARFGQFSAEGQLLDWHITTPKTPALFTQQLWHSNCGGGIGPPAGPPPSTENPNIHIDNLDFGSLPAGQDTVEHLTASGGTSPYTFAVSPGPTNESAVPSWVHVKSDGTVTINPPDGTDQSVSFYVYATDAKGEHSPFAREEFTFSVSSLSKESRVAYTSPGVISAISCASLGHCMILESRSDGAYGVGQSSGWSATKIPEVADPSRTRNGDGVPINTQYDVLNCYENGSFCIALGEYQDIVNGYFVEVPVIAIDEDDIWSAFKAPEPGPRGDSEGNPTFQWWRTDPSCAGKTFCGIVAQYQTDGSAAVIFNNGAWSTEWLPEEPESIIGPEAQGISCPSIGHCTAIGAGNEFQYGGAIWQYSLGTWLAESAPATAEAAGRHLSVPNQISCTSPSDCTAIGTSEGAFDLSWGEVFTESGGHWSAEDMPLPGEATDGGAESMSCYGPEECTFVLSVNFDGADSLKLHTYTFDQTPAGLSSPQPVDLPPDATSELSYAGAVTCESSSSCHGMARYYIGESESPVALLAINGGPPTVVKAPMIGGEELSIGYGSLYTSNYISDAMSCPTGQTCGLIGRLESKSVVVMLEE